MFKKKLIEKGFTEKDANFIIKHCPKGVSIEGAISAIGALLDQMHYTPKEVVRIVRFDQLILILSEQELIEGKNRLKGFGYKEEAIKKMITYYPSLIAYDVETLKRMIDFLIKYGFRKDQILNFTTRASNFYSLSKEYVEYKFSEMEELGFMKEEIIRMICFSPMSVKTDRQEFINTFEFLEEFSVEKEDMTRIISYIPSILKPDKKELHEKLRVIIRSGLYREFLNNPTSLIQSAELTKARVDYFDNEGIRLTGTTRPHVFMSGEKFKRQYGVSNEQILATYHLRQDLKQKRNNLVPKD